MKIFKSVSKSTLWSAVKFILAGSLVAFIISQISWIDFQSLFIQASFKHLALGLLFFFGFVLFATLRFQALAGHKGNFLSFLNLWILLRSASVFVASSLGIAGFIGGLKSEFGIDIAKGTLILLLAKVGDLFAFSIFLSISSIFVWPEIQFLHGTIIILLILSWGALLFFLLVIFNREFFLSKSAKLLMKTNLSQRSWIQKILSLMDSLVKSKDYNKMILLSFLYSFFGLLFLIIRSFINFQALNLEIAFWPATFITSTQYIISLIPINVLGGLGTVDASGLYLFELFGVETNIIPSLVLGLRTIEYLSAIITLTYIPIYNFIKRLQTRTNAPL